MVFADHASADQAKEAMATAVDGMRATLDKIDHEVTAATGWAGDARDAFAGASREWGDQSVVIHKMLDRMTQQVGHGTQDFKSMDLAGLDEFSHIRL